MIKSIFIEPSSLSGIETSNANHLIIALDGLNRLAWEKVNTGFDLSISLGCFGPDGCPANPSSKEKLFAKIEKAIVYHPKQIWLDHFRFDGHWEAIDGIKIPQPHPPCQWCQNKDRVNILKSIAEEIMAFCHDKTQVGYFAIPLLPEEYPDLITQLGHDHSLIGRIFDIASPMLYHRMINKPTSYISEYVKYISLQTQKPVLPIIQVTDEPSDGPDNLSETEITSAYHEATKAPSLGASFFWWTSALRKNKTSLIRQLFSK